MYKEMDCPCVCEVCGEVFELEDGIASERLKSAYGQTVICESCGKKEQEEIEQEEEISDLESVIEEAEYTLKSARERLAELQSK